MRPHTKDTLMAHAVSSKAFDVGTMVSWTSSNTRKTGVVMAVIPVGKRPADFGYSNLDNSGMPRDHVTYVVKGGLPGKKQNTLYWPRTSLLDPVDGLSSDEIAWCHSNAALVRAVMAKRSALPGVTR